MVRGTKGDKMTLKSRVEKLEGMRPATIPDTREGRREWLQSLTDAELCELIGCSEDVTDEELAAIIEAAEAGRGQNERKPDTTTKKSG